MDLSKIASTLEAIKALHASGRGQVAYKDFNTGLGYVDYDLQPLVDRTFAHITPLITETPRLQGKGGDSTHWKEIYAINQSNVSPGVPERARNTTVKTGLRDHFAVYAELEFEDFVTWKGDLEAGNLTPQLKAQCVEDLFYASREAEERTLLYGNTGVAPGAGGNGIALGTPVQPTAAPVAGGALTAQEWDLYVVYLTPEGMSNATQTTIPTIVDVEGVVNDDWTYGGGSSAASPVQNVTTAGGNLSIGASAPVAAGVGGYAWFLGLHGAPTTAIYQVALTSINSVLITANPATTSQPLSSVTQDNSGNQYIFDGYLTQVWSSGTGLFNYQPTGTAGTGTPLTADGKGGIVEINADLLQFWNTNKLMPCEMLVGAQVQSDISDIIQSSPNYRVITPSGDSQGNLTGGGLARTYLGKFAMQGAEPLQIKLHPNMPAGMIFYRSKRLPYRVQGLQNLAVIRFLQEWRQIEWPIMHRSWDYAVNVMEAFELHFPGAFGIRSNIAPGQGSL